MMFFRPWRWKIIIGSTRLRKGCVYRPGCWTKNRGKTPKMDGENFMVPNPMNKWMIWGETPLLLVQHPYLTNLDFPEIAGGPISLPKRYILSSQHRPHNGSSTWLPGKPMTAWKTNHDCLENLQKTLKHEVIISILDIFSISHVTPPEN